MANLSQIKLPNGTTYDLKDNTEARSNHRHYQSDLVPLQSKTYTGVIATANDDANCYKYCIKVVPDSYSGQWDIKYRLVATIDNVSAVNGNGRQESIVYISGMRNTYATYHTWNNITNTSYRPIYYHTFRPATETGISYGHLIGPSLRYAYNPATATNKRNITIEILDYNGCTVTLFDSMLIYANVPGTGSTNYNNLINFDATTQGNTMSGDRNDVNYYNRSNYGSRTTSAALYRYQFCLTKRDGTLVPVNTVNNSVATNKTLTTDTFDPFGEIFYWNSTTTYSANTNVGNGSWYRQYLCDLRYSFNCGGYDVASTLTARQPLYLVCSLQSDGMAKLHSSPLSMTLPTSDDGLIYIYLGRVYEDTYPYRVVLTFNHPVYWYKDGAIRQYGGDNLVTQTATTTNANYEILFSGTADDTTRTEGVRKSYTLTYNPSTRQLSTTGYITSRGISSSASDSDGDHSTNIAQTYSQLQISGYSDSSSGLKQSNLSVSGSNITLKSTYHDDDEDETYECYIKVAKRQISLCGDDDYAFISIDTDAETVGLYNLRTPTSNYDAATKKYVDDNVATRINTAGTGLSKSGTTLNHSNSITAQTTQAVYPIKIDAQGHISAYGSAITIPTIPSNNVTGSGTNGYLVKWNGTYTTTNGPQLGSSTTTFLRNDGSWATPVGTTYSVVSKTANGLTPQLPNETTTTKFLRQDGSWAVPTYTTNTDIKLQVAEVTSATQYYPIVGTGTTAATRQYDTTGFKYKGTTGTTSAVGSAILELGNSTASGTAGNKQAQLIMYGTNAKKATITLAAPSADIALALPTSGGTVALTSQIPTIPSSTGSSTTGITIANHGTGTVIGVQSSTTTASKVTIGSHSTDYGVTAAGSGSSSLTFTMDTTDTKKLKITFSHTHTAPTLGSKVPTVSASDVTVPIKNASASTFVTGTTHTITDNGHTHTI